MGGEERVARQHASWRLTVRERIERLFDDGSFRETGALAGRGTYEDGELVDFLPANCVVGRGRIDGRPAVVQGDDFTVRGGAADAAIWQKMVYAERLASELRMPLVRLVDGTGGGGSVKSLEDMGHTYVPFIPGWELAVQNLSTVPVVAAALGPVAGLGAARVVASHFSVIVRDTAQLFVAGPPVVAAAMGETPDKEELGGARAQTRAGAVDNEAADEDDALGQLRRFLSYLPSNVWEAPPVAASSDPPDRREEELLSIVPRERRQPYKPRRILEAVFDANSVFELGARYGRSLITALARLDGRPVAVLCSDPNHYAGGLTADASEKLTRFVDVADQFRLPGRELRRPARVRDRHRGGAARHHQARHPRAHSRLPGQRALGVRARAEGIRRGGGGPQQRGAAERSLRVAVGRLGLAADRGRHRGGVPARAGGGGGPGGAARGDRGAAQRGALAVPYRGALHDRGHHRPSRHPPAPLRVGRAGA
jgi:acetyl-CoA carboxylase carboxyltransferase component